MKVFTVNILLKNQGSFFLIFREQSGFVVFKEYVKST